MVGNRAMGGGGGGVCAVWVLREGSRFTGALTAGAYEAVALFVVKRCVSSVVGQVLAGFA